MIKTHWLKISSEKNFKALSYEAKNSYTSHFIKQTAVEQNGLYKKLLMRLVFIPSSVQSRMRQTTIIFIPCAVSGDNWFSGVGSPTQQSWGQQQPPRCFQWGLVADLVLRPQRTQLDRFSKHHYLDIRFNKKIHWLLGST